MDAATTRVPPRDVRRIVIEGATLAALGALMGVLGPYGTIDVPAVRRYLYWLLAITLGGAVGIAIDRLLRRPVLPLARRVVVTGVAMTPLVTLLVELLNTTIMRQPVALRDLGELAWRVLVISLLVMSIRALAWRAPAVVVETRTLVVPPTPEAETAFRRRLSARARAAPLVAIEAHDHYLKVHTDNGCEMITARFSDALAELAHAYGYRTHRSWWVAADRIESVRWSRGGGSVTLAGGVVAPVSRAQAATLREAGW